MKNKILIICLIIFFNNSSFCQEKISGNVVYKKTMLDISSKIKKENSKKTFLEFRKKINNNLKKVTYTLSFNAKESLFFSSKVMETDVDRSLKLAINFGGGRGILYTNLKNKIKLHQADGFGERFLIRGKIEYKWIVTQKTKKIDKYLCYKAVLKSDSNKKDIVAWFCPNIPYSFGPNGYCGLPGLIIELELNNGFLFKAYNIKLQKNTSKIILKPVKGVKISEEEFLSIGKKSMERKN